MVIVDSTVWIDWLRNRRTIETTWLSASLSSVRIGLTDLILCEVLQGVANESVAKQVERELSSFEVFRSGGERLALTAAGNYRMLRARGLTVRKTVDCLIATFCMEGDYSLLHNDRDFNAFEQHLGLRVIHPPVN